MRASRPPEPPHTSTFPSSKKQTPVQVKIRSNFEITVVYLFQKYPKNVDFLFFCHDVYRHSQKDEKWWISLGTVLHNQDLNKLYSEIDKYLNTNNIH